MAELNDDDGVIAAMPDLQIEVSHHEDLLILQQLDQAGNADRIAIHKWQVQMLAEHFGLLPMAQPAPRRDVALILARRLRRLHERVDELGKYLNEFDDDDFAKNFSLATCEIGDEFLADLPELLGHALPAMAPRPSSAPPPPLPPTARVVKKASKAGEQGSLV